MKLYFAYGSNLNKRQMILRCPAAIPCGEFTLTDARLVFRSCADVIVEEGSTCVGGIWLVTEECERALDRYEGIGSGLYRKVYIPLPEPVCGQNELMFYQMNSNGIMPPAIGYLNSIREGYRDFGLDQRHLDAAVEHAHDDKAPSHIERQRHRRKGLPELAQRPSLVTTAPQTKKSKRAAKRAAKRGQGKLFPDPCGIDQPAEARRKQITNLDDWLRERRESGRSF